MAFELRGSAFKSDDPIPHRYTCEDEDLSPPLHCSVPPAATRSFVIIADDPDAPVGTWVHCVIYDLHLDLRGAHGRCAGQGRSAQRGSARSERLQAGYVGKAHSRMLKTSVSQSCSFGLFGLSGSFGEFRSSKNTPDTPDKQDVSQPWRAIGVLPCRSH